MTQVFREMFMRGFEHSDRKYTAMYEQAYYEVAEKYPYNDIELTLHINKHGGQVCIAECDQHIRDEINDLHDEYMEIIIPVGNI